MLEWLAIGMGLGFVPWAPGTAGAAAGVLFALMLARLRFRWRLLATVMLTALAVAACEVGSRSHADDSPHIVADELLTLPIATIALPIARHPMLLAGIFVVSRVLDIIKPPPAGVAEQVPGGLGIVLDDVASNLWSLGLGMLAWRWWRRRQCCNQGDVHKSSPNRQDRSD
ncbi:MAG: phosphatidylglycerophosphatase A [Wenzhouxiangellaceae bacterium]|nr:phosphatidylglycerophosphatase A [Wenzhouxiangellaceae bacterium]